MRTANRQFLALLLLLVVPSCYSPAIDDGQYTCNDGMCPAGFVCTHCHRCVAAEGNVNDDEMCKHDLTFTFNDDGGGQLDGAGPVDLSAPEDQARADLALALDMRKPVDLLPPSDLGGCYCIFSQQLNGGAGGCYLTLGGAGGMADPNLSGSCPNGCVALVDGGQANCGGKMCEPQPREGVNCH